MFHGADMEMSFLREYLSPGIDKWKAEMPGNLYIKDRDFKYPIVIQDTQRLYAAYKADPEYASTILHSACTIERIPCHKVLNAGKPATACVMRDPSLTSVVVLQAMLRTTCSTSIIL